MKGGASLTEQQAPALMSFVCVECGRPVARLFREYNKGSIRLGRCVSHVLCAASSCAAAAAVGVVSA